MYPYDLQMIHSISALNMLVLLKIATLKICIIYIYFFEFLQNANLTLSQTVSLHQLYMCGTRGFPGKTGDTQCDFIRAAS